MPIIERIANKTITITVDGEPVVFKKNDVNRYTADVTTKQADRLMKIPGYWLLDKDGKRVSASKADQEFPSILDDEGITGDGVSTLAVPVSALMPPLSRTDAEGEAEDDGTGEEGESTDQGTSGHKIGDFSAETALAEMKVKEAADAAEAARKSAADEQNAAADRAEQERIANADSEKVAKAAAAAKAKTDSNTNEDPERAALAAEFEKLSGKKPNDSMKVATLKKAIASLKDKA